MIKTQPTHLIPELIEQHKGLIYRLCPKQQEVTGLIQTSCSLSLSDLEMLLPSLAGMVESPLPKSWGCFSDEVEVSNYEPCVERHRFQTT